MHAAKNVLLIEWCEDMDIDIELWMDATDDDEEMMEPSPCVQDVFEQRVGMVQLVDSSTLPSMVDDVSGKTRASGRERGYEVRKTVIDGRLVDMQVGRI